MLTVAQLQQLQNEVESLKRSIAEKQGVIKQFKADEGNITGGFKKKLIQLETQRVSLEKEFQQKLADYQRKHRDYYSGGPAE